MEESQPLSFFLLSFSGCFPSFLLLIHPLIHLQTRHLASWYVCPFLPPSYTWVMCGVRERSLVTCSFVLFASVCFSHNMTFGLFGCMRSLVKEILPLMPFFIVAVSFVFFGIGRREGRRLFVELWSLYVLSSSETSGEGGVCVCGGGGGEGKGPSWWLHFADCVVRVNNGKIHFVEMAVFMVWSTHFLV